MRWLRRQSELLLLCSILSSAPGFSTRPRVFTLATKRRDLVHGIIGISVLGPATASAVLVAQQARRLQKSTVQAEDSDPTLANVTSANDLAPRRWQLQREWQQIRAEPAGRVATEQAFARVLAVRQAIGVAEDLVSADRLAEVGGVLDSQIIHDLESSATILATSAVLSTDTRRAIGWEWGACGWRLCGAQADATQALCKLIANLGMATSIEARFYLDVAKRAVDAPDGDRTAGGRCRAVRRSRSAQSSDMAGDAVSIFQREGGERDRWRGCSHTALTTH